MPKILTARPPQDAGEEAKIRKLAHARHAPADWIERAKIITASWEGLRVPAIADRLGCHEQKVRRWLHRFNTTGIDGLDNRPGCGRKPRISQDERSTIIALARSDPPGRLSPTSWGELQTAAEEGKAPIWTLDTLTEAARELGIDIHRSQVRVILLREGVPWRRTHTWATSTDADFAGKEPRSSACTPTRPRAPRSSAPMNWDR
jgi:transposase